MLDLRALCGLVSLQLFANPLEYLPELSPATALRSLSLANVRIMADAAYTRWAGVPGCLTCLLAKLYGVQLESLALWGFAWCQGRSVRVAGRTNM